MIKIYGMNTCESCLYVKQLCQINELEFDFIELKSLDDIKEMRSKYGKTDVPLIIWDDEIIVGPNDFKMNLMRRMK